MTDDTMIDERALTAALTRVADAEPVPAGAMARLLEVLEGPTVRASGLPPSRVRHTGAGVRPRRRVGVVAAAASIVMVAGALVGVLAGGGATGGGVTGLAAGAHGAARAPALPAAGGDQAAAATPANAAASAAAAAGSAAAAGAGGASSTVPSPADATRVVKNGHIGLLVGHGRVQSVVADISLLGAAQGGYVSSTSMSLSQGPPSGSVVVEVPEAQFDLVVDEVRRLGQVEQLSTSGQDVTSQYVNLQAQITAAQQTEQRYLTILGQATSIGDILAVQQQIDTIDTQLQQLQGQQQLLDQQTTYGTLSVTVAESAKVVVVTPPSGWSRAWHNAGHGFAAASEAIVSASGIILFLGLCLLVLAGAGWLVWRRLRPRLV